MYFRKKIFYCFLHEKCQIIFLICSVMKVLLYINQRFSTFLFYSSLPFGFQKADCFSPIKFSQKKTDQFFYFYLY